MEGASDAGPGPGVCVCGGPYWRGTQGSRPQACDTSRAEDAVTPGQGRRCEVLGRGRIKSCAAGRKPPSAMTGGHVHIRG